MSFRRNMMFTLGAFIQGLIEAFKTRVAAVPASFEAESYLLAQLNDLNNKNLLSTATLVLTPNAVSEGKAYAIIPTNGNGDMGWSRASTAWAQNAAGVIDEAPTQNLLLKSQTIVSGTIPWWHNFGTIQADASITAPDGTNTASRLAQNVPLVGSNNGIYAHYGYINNVTSNPSFPSSEIRTFYIYAKANVCNFIGVALSVGGLLSYSSPVVTKVNLTTGTVVQSGTDDTVTLQNAGNGWYRICISKSTAWNKIQIFNSTQQAALFQTNSGDGLYIWGAQAVIGNQSLSTPYFPTTTRNSVPRIDYSEGVPVLLVEPTKTNYLLRSEEFNTANWVKTNVTVTSDSTTDPNNLIHADTLTATAASGQTRQNAASNNSPVGRVVSVYVKRKTGTGDCRLEAGRFSTTFNPSSGWTRVQVVDTGTAGTYTVTAGAYTATTSVPHGLTTGDSIIIAVNSNQFVASITVTGPNTITWNSGGSTTSGLATVYAHHMKLYIDTNGDEIYVWGAQLEQIQNFTSIQRASTYIPTTTAAATRATENLTLNNLVSNGIFGSNWSMYTNLKRNGGSNSVALHIIGLMNTTNADYFGLLGISNSTLSVSKRENSGTATITGLTYQPSENNFMKILFTMNGSTGRFWLDGALLYEATFAAPQNLVQLSNASNQTIMIRELDAWNYALSDSEIFKLFTYPLHTVGVPLSSELQAVVNRAYADGFTLPSNSQLQHIDTLIADMKTNGIWGVTDCFFIYAFNDINLENFSRICLKNPNGQLATFNGGYIYKTIGIGGNGSNSFVDTKFNPALATFNYTLNNAGRMAVVSDAGLIVSQRPYDSAAGGVSNVMRTTNLTSNYINSNNPSSASFAYGGTGIKSIMRDDATNIRLQNDNTLAALTQTSTTITNGNQYLLSGVGGLYSDATISSYWIGGSISNGQITNFRSSYNTFLTNMGLAPIA